MKSQHSLPNGVLRKARKSNNKGIITEKINAEALKANLQEEPNGDPIPLRHVPQYFKDYTVDEVVIVMHVALRPYQNDEEYPEDGIYDGPSRTREIDIDQEGEPDKPMFIVEHFT